MATTIGRLAAVLTADTTGFAAGMAKADRMLHSFARRFGVATGAAAAFGTMAGNLALNALAAMGRAANATMAQLDNLGKAADRLGMSTESLGALSHAASLAGVDFAQLETGLVQLLKRLDEASTGGGEAAKAVARLGLSVRDLKSMSADKAVLTLADAMAKISDPGARTRIRLELFGKGGNQLGTLLNDPEGTRRAMTQAGEQRLLFSRDQIASIERFRDVMDTLGRTLGAAFARLALAVLPDFERNLKTISDALHSFSSFIIFVINELDLGIAEFRSMLGGGRQMLADAKRRIAAREAALSGIGGPSLTPPTSAGDAPRGVGALGRQSAGLARIASGFERYGQEGQNIEKQQLLTMKQMYNLWRQWLQQRGVTLPVMP